MRTLGAAGLLALAAASAWAQDTTSVDIAPGATWTDVAYPKVFYTGREGLVAGGYVAVISPLSFSDFDRPESYRASLSASGEVSTRGSRDLVLEARLPHFAPGWRFALTVNAKRRAHENYFGIGNASVFDQANETAAQPDFYRARITRYLARGEVQRHLAGHVRLLAGLHAERWRLDTLAGVTQLARDRTAGLDPAISRAVGDVSGRVGLVFDARDNEAAPRRGGLVEVIVGRADSRVAGDVTYTRAVMSASGYVPLGQRLVIAGRFLGQRMWGTPPLGTYFTVDTSDRPFTGLGGGESHRGLPENRLLGPDKLLVNLDARYDVFAVPTLARVTLVGFLDAGRVFMAEQFTLTTQALKVGGGAGTVMQFGRAGILGLTLGTGPDGVVAQALTRWTY
ncbi:MAG: BamA/TamA family outer membrane protein [Gemmatimonadetes bacterium]|nr:BamA/TamA family outer membrane protein [Gemmatimonadota bacterium]